MLKLAHFRKTLFKCDIGLVHLTSKVISIPGTVDRSLNNYNANYCKALTTVTFNRMGMVLDIPCNLESIRVPLAVTYQKHLQRKEKQFVHGQSTRNPKNSCMSSVCRFISKMSIIKSSLLDKNQTNSLPYAVHVICAQTSVSLSVFL